MTSNNKKKTTADFLTIKEVAKILSIHTSTARRLASKGDLPATKVGNIWRVLKTDLENYAGYKIEEERGRGRPPDKEEKISVTLRIPVSKYDEIKIKAYKLGLTVPSWSRLALYKVLKQGLGVEEW